MSKLAFFFMAFAGAIPAGGALYALIMNLLDRADSLGTVLLAVTVTATLCTAMVVLTPFIVLVFYKDTRPAFVPPPPQEESDDDSLEPGEEEGFGDAIPEDFDENELAAADDEEEYGDFDDDEYGEFDDSEYDDGEFDDFEEEDF